MTIFTTLRQKETTNRRSLQIKLRKSSPHTSINMRRVHSHERSSNAAPIAAKRNSERNSNQLWTQLKSASERGSDQQLNAAQISSWTQLRSAAERSFNRCQTQLQLTSNAVLYCCQTHLQTEKNAAQYRCRTHLQMLRSNIESMPERMSKFWPVQTRSRQFKKNRSSPTIWGVVLMGCYNRLMR